MCDGDASDGTPQPSCCAPSPRRTVTAADVLLEKKNPQDLAQAVAGEAGLFVER